MKKSSVVFGLFILLATTLSTASAMAYGERELNCEQVDGHRITALVDSHLQVLNVKIDGEIRNSSIRAAAKVYNSFVINDENGRPATVRINGAYHPALVARWTGISIDCH